MATGSGKRGGRKERPAEHGSSGSGHDHTGLPVQPLHEAGNERDTPIRVDGCAEAACAPGGDAERGSAARSEWQDSVTALFGNRRGLRAGSNGHRGNGTGSQEESIQCVETTELTQLPNVPDRYIEPPEEAVAEATGDGVRDRDELRLEQDHALLTRVASKGLKVLEEVLDISTPVSTDPNYLRVVALKKDAAISGVTARLKADENAFRKRQSDALSDLYEQVGAVLGHRPGHFIEGTSVQVNE